MKMNWNVKTKLYDWFYESDGYAFEYNLKPESKYLLPFASIIAIVASGLIILFHILFMVCTILLIPIELICDIFVSIKEYYNNRNIGRITNEILNKHAELLHSKYDDMYLNYKGIEYNTCLDDYKNFIKWFITTGRCAYNTTVVTKNEVNHYYCGTDRRRSLGDIYLITKHYFPNVTILQVLHTLFELIDSKKISGSFCTMISKYVFHNDSKYTSFNDLVEYNNYNNKLIDYYKAYQYDRTS